MILLFLGIVCVPHKQPTATTAPIVHQPVDSGAETTPQMGMGDTHFRGYKPDGSVAVLSKDCMRCRKRPGPTEKQFIESCKSLGGESYYCGCFEILCSVNIAP